MIPLASIISVLAAVWARAAAAEFAPAVPLVGLAWVVVLARRSPTGAFVAAAIAFGLVDGVVSLTAWTYWPPVYLMLGLLAFWTRRLIPVSRAGGEAVISAFFAAAAHLIFWTLRGSSDLGRGWPFAWAPIATGIATTGIVAGMLIAFVPRWPAAWLRRTRA